MLTPYQRDRKMKILPIRWFRSKRTKKKVNIFKTKRALVPKTKEKRRGRHGRRSFVGHFVSLPFSAG